MPACPIFQQAWWLDIVCKSGEWKLLSAKNKQGEILGTLPYFITRIAGMRLIRTPPFTPYLGVWLDYSKCSGSLAKRYGFENEVIADLVKQLPKVASYHQVHPEQLQNWLPFYWLGYRQTTRYTYIFEELNPVRIWEGMKDKTRNLIRKARRLGLSVRQENDLEKFLVLQAKTFARQGISLRQDADIFRSLHEEIHRRGQGAIYFAEDESGIAHAALYLVWDAETAYCWQLGADTELRKSGAVQLLLWHSIEAASQKVRRYNFEGSILPHIEPVFRAFGAERKAVFQIRKFGNRFLEALWVLLKG